MKVNQIMSKEVISIKPKDNIKDALMTLFKYKISGLPVIDENQRLVGMFTEKDILREILPSYIERVGRFVYEENPKSIRKRLETLTGLPVSLIMRKEVVTVSEDTTLCEVGQLMLLQKARRIPVLDNQKKVVGIVAREDVIKAYAKEAGWIVSD
ncbi:MAG: CBS domain-containing protein [Candidatus Omnitrophica bacterium]|nr:CBS domain-containing protein [Candidatus Omnitrophota bacterium]